MRLRIVSLLALTMLLIGSVVTRSPGRTLVRSANARGAAPSLAQPLAHSLSPARGVTLAHKRARVDLMRCQPGVNCPPPPSISVTPGTSTIVSDNNTLAIQISWCDTSTFGSHKIVYNGADVTSSFTFTSSTSTLGCHVHFVSTGNVNLLDKADSLIVSASDQNPLFTYDTIVYNFTQAIRRLHITMAAGATHGTPSSRVSVGWTVTNLGNTTDTINVKNHCNGAALNPPTHCFSTPDSIMGLAPGGTWSGTAFVDLDSILGLTGRLETIAFERTHTVTDTGYTDITIQNPLGPGVVLNTVTPDVTHPRDKCVTIEIRPGIAYECGDLRVVHALPTTQTYNKARTPSLIYNSNMATGVNAIGALLTFDPAKGTPDTVKATLTDSATGQIVGSRQWLGSYWVNGATQRVTVRMDGELGLENLGTRYVYTFTATAIYNAAHTTQSFSATGAQLATSLANGPGFAYMLAGQEFLIIPQWTGATPWNSTKPLFWSNSEGDTRQYNAVPNDSLVWAAVGVDRPDTIKSYNGPKLYGLYRYAEHGAVVHFDPHGPELAVIDRLGDSTRLVDTAITGAPYSTSVDIPAPNGGGLPYVFLHDSWKARLDSIVAPSVSGQSRTVHFRYDTLNLYTDTIKDPDGSFEVYNFQNGQPHLPYDNLLISYQDKRGTITRFHYDSAFKLIQAITDSGPTVVLQGETPSLNIQWSFQPAESQGLTTPVAPDSAYTLVAGPRAHSTCQFPQPPCPDSADVTRFWVDQWGEPTRIRDAHGDEIELTRANPTYPSLVTYARYQNGRVVTSTYDKRGNPQSTTDSSFSINGTFATTQYTFDTLYDFVTEIAQPAGEIETFHYDSTTGNRLWQQPGTNPLRKVQFSYYPKGSGPSGQLQSIVTPVESPLATTVKYDPTLANEDTVTTPLGISTSTVRDAVGRVVAVRSPIDATDSRTDSTQYDAMDRAIFTSSHAPALTHNFVSDTALVRPYRPPLGSRTADSAALTVSTTFDVAGAPKTILRTSLPDTNHIGSMRTDFVYDAAGRAIQKTQHWGGSHDSTATDTTGFDANGNAVRTVTRRSDTITATFDALNRMVQRILPAREYARDANAQLTAWGMTLPQYPNCSDGTGFCIPADTATFAFDHAGNQIIANNGDARITRAYSQNGTLAADTLRIRSYTGNDFTQHVYGINYTYDLDGRRLTMTHPSTLAPVNGGVQLNKNTYIYDTEGIGELTDVTDIFGNVFDYQYDLDGRAFHLNSSDGAALQHWTYDADSRLIARIDSTPNTSPTNGWQYNELHHDTISYDMRGLIVMVHDTALDDRVRVFNAYSGLGALTDALIYHYTGLAPGYPVQWNEQYTWGDAFGNAFGTFTDNMVNAKQLSDSANSFTESAYQPGSGRLLESGFIGSGTNIYANASVIAYDSSGNTARTLSTRSEGTSGYIAIGQDQYYDAAQHLRAVDKHFCFFGGGACELGAPSYSDSDLPYMQMYRYDALGRRILAATLPSPLCVGQSRALPICQGYIERTVYDGNQVLVEVRMPDTVGISAQDIERDTGGTATYENTRIQFGRVVYTHGLGIDDPVDVVRVGFDTLYPGPTQIIPMVDWRGGYDAAVLANGAEHVCTGLQPDSTFQINPNLCFTFMGTDPQYGAYHQDLLLNSAPIYPLWNGSLTAGRRDVTNQIYLRNRYYDPQTGRFTQEDPIGLAGGLNDYGFAGGDPVNYSDPFGLCPDPKDPKCPVGGPGTASGAMAVAQQIADKHLGAATAEFAVGVAALGTAGGVALTAGPGVTAAVSARLAAAGPAAAKLLQQGPMIEMQEGEAQLVAANDGQLIARASISLSHSVFVERAFVPDGSWVGTVGKVEGAIMAVNSMTIMGNQAVAPAQIQDLMRSIFK
jgi:RHS repeat-associated protein